MLWIFAGVAVVGAVAAVVGIWHLPDRMYPGADVDVGEARAALQGGLLTAAAALLAVAGGLVALDETRQANAQVHKANENTHVRELYVEGVKLLSDTERGTRVAGVYALERVAVDSPSDQRTIVAVLSAFIREHSTRPALRAGGSAGDEDAPSAPSEQAWDVHTAVTVLARLPVRRGIPRGELRGANLTGPAALRYLQARNGNLAGVDLSGADLTSADLTGANLSGANLNQADLSTVSLHRADLTRASLRNARFLDTRLVETNFMGAAMDGATFIVALLSGAKLTNAWLAGARFAGVGVGAGHVAIGGVDYGMVKETDFTEANLTNADLTGMIHLSQQQVNSARGNGLTRLPPGVVRPALWGPEERPEAE